MSGPSGNIDTGLQATYFAHWLSAFCIGINERQDCLALTETAFEYNEEGDRKTRPTPQDFQGDSADPGTRIKLHGTKINTILTSIQTAITALVPANRWVPDMETETTTTLAAILTEVGLGSFPTSANAWNANDWARIYGVLDRLLYAKIWPSAIANTLNVITGMANYNTIPTYPISASVAWAAISLSSHTGHPVTSIVVGKSQSYYVGPAMSSSYTKEASALFDTEKYSGVVGIGYVEFRTRARYYSGPLWITHDTDFVFDGNNYAMTEGGIHKIPFDWIISSDLRVGFSSSDDLSPSSSMISYLNNLNLAQTSSMQTGSTSSNTFFLLDITSELTDQSA